jgi:hypothetical protein
MSETAEEVMPVQFFPVPQKVWSLLRINRADWLPKIWAEWPLDVREEWMRLARVSMDYSVPPAWEQIPQEDRQRILKRIRQFREMYVQSKLGEVWHRIAWATESKE